VLCGRRRPGTTASTTTRVFTAAHALSFQRPLAGQLRPAGPNGISPSEGKASSVSFLKRTWPTPSAIGETVSTRWASRWAGIRATAGRLGPSPPQCRGTAAGGLERSLPAWRGSPARQSAWSKRTAPNGRGRPGPRLGVFERWSSGGGGAQTRRGCVLRFSVKSQNRPREVRGAGSPASSRRLSPAGGVSDRPTGPITSPEPRMGGPRRALLLRSGGARALGAAAARGGAVRRRQRLRLRRPQTSIAVLSG